VDDATVEIENINRNLAMGKKRPGNPGGAQQIACRFCLHVCIALFSFHVFPVRRCQVSLYPLAEAVSFAHASFLYVVADHRSDAGNVSPELGDEYHSEDHIGEKMGFFRRYQQGF